MDEDPRVLVVEDAPQLLRLFERMLDMAGYRVIGLPDAETALAALPDAGDLAVAVLDLSLPGVGGVELARKLWATAPGLPVVFATGSDGPPAAELQGASHVYRILHKPFLTDALVAAIEAARTEARSHRQSSSVGTRLSEP